MQASSHFAAILDRMLFSKRHAESFYGVRCSVQHQLNTIAGEAPCGAHVFEGFFGLENGPVKSDKSQEKTLLGKDFPKPAKTQS